TAQKGDALTAALEARERWLYLAEAVGLWLEKSGSLFIARADDELEVLNEFACTAEHMDVELLAPAEVLKRVPIASSGGLATPLDLRVDPRQAIPALADWLAEFCGVRFLWGTTVTGADPGLLHTTCTKIK